MDCRRVIVILLIGIGEVINYVKTNIHNGGTYSDRIIKIQFKFYQRHFIGDERVLLDEISSIESYKDLVSFINNHRTPEQLITFSGSSSVYENKDSCELIYQNHFFEILNDRKNINNWIDIENEYYKLLKDCLKKDKEGKKVFELNREFENVKELLETYLSEEICQKYDFVNGDVVNELVALFLKRPLFLDATQDESDYLKEFHKRDHEDLISLDNYYLESIKEGRKFENIHFNKNLFLNFNYTPTVLHHVDLMKSNKIDFYGNNSIIHIHGEIGDANNQIIFGFGDEMDEDYKMIENEDNNEYLKNIKSFQYLQNSNYKDMLDFIDSEKFQVYIMGHSCGLSDRILLNKIFEHDNCRSIKIFYHHFDEPKSDGRADNYTEIIQNISRHFNKKEMMREKIVPKPYCKPFPQIKLSLKENGLQS